MGNIRHHSEAHSVHRANQLQKLRGFCYAAQFGNISRAAMHMGLTHASVSLQIKALEEDLGCQLFERSGPKIKLTPDGQRLLEIAQPMVESIYQIREIFLERKSQLKYSELRLGVNATAQNYLAAGLIKHYLQLQTDAHISLYQSEHEIAMELLEADQLDIALLPRRAHLPLPRGYTYASIYNCSPNLITLPDHPLAGRTNLSVDEIRRYPLILPAAGLEVIPGLHDLFGGDRTAMDSLPAVTFLNSETGREFVEAGIGITISSDIWMRKNDILKATPLPHILPSIDYGLYYKSRRIMTPKMLSFIEAAKQHAADRL